MTVMVCAAVVVLVAIGVFARGEVEADKSEWLRERME